MTDRSSYWRDLGSFYREQLLDSCLPFWLKHGRDEACGGYFFCLNRDGSVYEEDKICMWSHGRMAWTFAYLHNEIGPNAEWLEMARRGVDFILRHGFAPEGGLYYALTRDGQPLQAPCDVSVANSTVLGFSEVALATGDEALYARARALSLDNWERYADPARAYPFWLPETRPARCFGHYMITLNVLQVLRRYREEADFERMIDTCIEEMLGRFVRPEKKAVLEMTAWDGSDLPGWSGRRANPGHMMEGGLFLIHEAQRRNDADLLRRGVELIDWGWAWGWDRDYGGLFNDVDIEGLPVPSLDALRYDSKLWWQHTEGLYALLLAYSVSGQERFREAHDQLLDYCKTHFLDPEYGEWFATLDRTGRRVNDAKGTERKSCFHLARNLFHAWRLCREMTATGATPSSDRG